MSLRLIGALIAGVLAASCATPAPPPAAVLEYAHTDCTAAPELSDAITLTPPHERAEFDVSTSIDDHTPCLGEAASATPYVVYALPSDYGDKTITVGAAVEPGRIFAASAVLLDANGAVTRTLASDQFTYRGGLYSAQFRPHQGESYLLVKADRAVVGQNYNSISLGTGTATGCGPTLCMNWTYGTEARQSTTFSYTGTVQVQVFDSVTGGRASAQQGAH